MIFENYTLRGEWKAGALVPPSSLVFQNGDIYVGETLNYRVNDPPSVVFVEMFQLVFAHIPGEMDRCVNCVCVWYAVAHARLQQNGLGICLFKSDDTYYGTWLSGQARPLMWKIERERERHRKIV